MGQNLSGTTSVWLYYGSEEDFASRLDVPASSITVTSSNKRIAKYEQQKIDPYLAYEVYMPDEYRYKNEEELLKIME